MNHIVSTGERYETAVSVKEVEDVGYRPARDTYSGNVDYQTEDPRVTSRVFAKELEFARSEASDSDSASFQGLV